MIQLSCRKQSPEREACPVIEEPAGDEPAAEIVPILEPEPQQEAAIEQYQAEPELVDMQDLEDMGTPEADTVPNSPNSSPSRLSTALSLEWASRTPQKRPHNSPPSSE